MITESAAERICRAVSKHLPVWVGKECRGSLIDSADIAFYPADGDIWCVYVERTTDCMWLLYGRDIKPFARFRTLRELLTTAQLLGWIK